MSEIREVKELFIYSSSIDVKTVDDITTTNLIASDYGNRFDTIYSFTIEEPAVIKVVLSQTRQKYHSLCDLYAIISGAEADGALINGTTPKMEYGKTYARTLTLEAGTYYVRFNYVPSIGVEKDENQNGSISIGVYAQYVPRTEDHFSLKTAKILKVNKEDKCLFTNSIHNLKNKKG